MGLVVESRFHPDPKENEWGFSHGFTQNLNAGKQIISFVIQQSILA